MEALPPGDAKMRPARPPILRKSGCRLPGAVRAARRLQFMKSGRREAKKRDFLTNSLLNFHNFNKLDDDHFAHLLSSLQTPSRPPGETAATNIFRPLPFLPDHGDMGAARLQHRHRGPGLTAPAPALVRRSLRKSRPRTGSSPSLQIPPSLSRSSTDRQRPGHFRACRDPAVSNRMPQTPRGV